MRPGLNGRENERLRLVETESCCRIDFAEWTGADKLRHTQFVALRDDKDPPKVVKEISRL
jgi:ATP-dependent DNA ligase